MSPKETAYIVERLAVRFMSMVADYERKMVEHRDAFGVRTSADAKIIDGMRAEVEDLRNRLNSLGIQAAKRAGEALSMVEGEGLLGAALRVVKERDGLLTQVQDQRAEMNRLQKRISISEAEINKIDELVNHDREDSTADKVAELRQRLVESTIAVRERDLLRREAVQESLETRAKLSAEIERLSGEVSLHSLIKREYDKALMLCESEEQTPEECIISLNVRLDNLQGNVGELTRERDALRAEVAALQERLRASIARGDFAQMEVAQLKSQTPKQHPVKVGAWVRRTKKCAHFGHVAKVLAFIEPCSYEVQCIEGRGIWYFHNCEPCDTPEATHAEPDLTQLHAKGKEAWSDVPNATQWVEEMRGNSEATHDTEQGKATAESALKTEPVAEEIKVGDLGEVFQATTRTLNSDVGITGRVSSVHLDPCHGGFLVTFDPSTQSRRSAGMQAFGLCDVRKVTT